MSRALIFVCFSFFTVACSGGVDGSLGGGPLDYANSSYITDVSTVYSVLESPDVLVLDVRPAELYVKGHIKGAVNVQWQDFTDVSGEPGDAGYGVALDPAALTEVLYDLGVTGATTIFTYADGPDGWGEDGHLVWTLRLIGFEDAMMIDGGLAAWKGAGYPTATQDHAPLSATAQTRVEFIGIDKNWIANTSWMSDHVGNVKFVDARDLDEYNGDTPWGEARGGHMPGAISLPFHEVFDEGGTLKRQADLEALFTERGLSKDDTIVTYCTGGVRSAHLAVVMRAAGYQDTRNYDESFWYWSAQPDLAVE